MGVQSAGPKAAQPPHLRGHSIALNVPVLEEAHLQDRHTTHRLTPLLTCSAAACDMAKRLPMSMHSTQTLSYRHCVSLSARMQPAHVSTYCDGLRRLASTQEEAVHLMNKPL